MSEETVVLSGEQVRVFARSTASLIHDWARRRGLNHVSLFGIPRGGVSAAYAIAWQWQLLGSEYPITVNILAEPKDAHVLVDDLVDSGETMTRWKARYPEKGYFALFDKRKSEQKPWVVFPWEATDEQSAEDIFTRLLQFIGEDPTREGLRDTPTRMARAWREWTAGYQQSPSDVLKTFEDGAEKYDQMVVLRDIPVFSKCEHHGSDIVGSATVAYIPHGRIAGLSKIARLVQVFARRLQVQERLTDQIADAIQEHLEPLGVGVVVKARHLCMESRGINLQGHHTVTSAVRGVFRSEPAARAEFLNFVAKE